MKPDDRIYQVKIGEREIDNFEVVRLIAPGAKQPVGLFDFIVDMTKCKEFDNLDLKDDVNVWRRTDNKKVFGGYVDELFYNGNKAAFMCRGADRDYEHIKIRSYLFLNTNYAKISYFTARLAFKKSKIQFDARLLRQVDLRNRNYIVIMPVQNLILEQELVVSGTVFYQPSDSDEDKIIENSKTGKEDLDWNGKFPRAKVVVESTNFYDAILIGYEKISRAIDLLTLRTNLSFTRIDDSDFRPQFSNTKYLSRVSLPEKAFCKEENAPDTCFFDMRTIKETELKLEKDSSEYVIPVLNLLNDIATKQDSELTKNQRLIARSLRWLRLAIHSVDPITKLLDLWLSLEFAARGTGSRRFTDEEIKSIKEQTKQIKLSGRDLSEEQVYAIEGKLDMLNDAPLIEKVKQFVKQNDIAFSDVEFETIRKARKKRNDIEHGKGNVEVDREELEKLQSLIERIILARASNSI